MEKIMKPNKEALEVLAKDLRKEEPRRASERLAGYEMAARCLDKCRASLLGWQGDFTYGCPMDRQFLNEAGLDVNEFKDFVATGASDEEVAEWIEEHAQATAD
jgi:hypothetical protein